MKGGGRQGRPPPTSRGGHLLKAIWRHAGRSLFGLLVVCLAISVLTGAPRPDRALAADRPRSLVKVPYKLMDGRSGKSLLSNPEAEALQRRLVLYAERQHEVHRLFGSRHVSHKSHDLLRRRGLGPALLAHGSDPAKVPTATQRIDTLNILIVRISFESDRSGSLTSVTTDGNFQLGAAGPTDRIDPPPHNRNYFEAHLFGLSEFYRFQSGGRLAIRGRVLPDGLDDSYRLTDLADYGPGADGYWTLEGLERFVRDMIAAADTGAATASPPVSLADYDDDNPFSYVIFVHAGADWQSDINDDSPNDIPTFFVSLGEPEPLSSLDSETGQPGGLSECSVIPETTSQDGLLGSIASALYHEFGHALGLVDIYSTTTGLPQVGIWDLMDSGTNLVANIGFPHPSIPDSIEVFPVVGLLPPSLGAWDKWFLGWLDLATVGGPPAEYRLPAVQVPRTVDEYPRYRNWGYDFRLTYPQALVGGVSPREFFLVENRWVPATGDQLPEQTGIGFTADEQTGVILYLGGDPDPVTQQPRNTGMYDFFLPDGGLLVWHVNMDRIEPNLESNTINAFGDGLRLVEADGIQDIGVLDPYVLGFFGSYRDPFHEENGDALLADGAPSSRAFDRSWTGLELRDIAGTDPARAVMGFQGAVMPLAAGSPIALAPLDSAEAAGMSAEAGPRALDPGTATFVVLTAGSGARPALLLADAPPPDWTGGVYESKLFAFLPDGTPAAAGLPAGPGGAAWQFAAPVAGPPQLLHQPGGDHLLMGLRDGTVWDFDTILDAGDELVPRWGPVATGDSLAFAPAGTGDAGAYLLCATAPDTLRLLGLDGLLAPTPLILDAAAGGIAAALQPLRWPAAGFDGSWTVFARSGCYLVSQSDGELGMDPPLLLYSRPAMGEVRGAQVPGAGGVTLVAMDDAGFLGAWWVPAGGPATAFAWRGELDGPVVGEPAVADLNGDGHDDLVVTTVRKVHVFQADGIRVSGWPVTVTDLFPLPDSTGIGTAAVICDADGVAGNELFLATQVGHLFGLDARGGLLPRFPFYAGANGSSVLAVGPSASGGERLLWLLDAGGRRAPPLERRWWDGRAVAYRLPGSGTAAATSTEWLGLAGGSTRLGQSGLALSLPAPAAWKLDVDPLVLYPNPLRAGDPLTLRFFSATDRMAHLIIYNLEGEVVVREAIPTNASQVNEHEVTLPFLASGVYICQLERSTDRGVVRDLASLAVEK
jgi:M6 family metalloprotease-like protein